MVKIEEKTLIIFLPHPCPNEALELLQEGIISALKFQYANYTNAGFDPKLLDGNHLLLELLEATLKKEKEQTKTFEL